MIVVSLWRRLCRSAPPPPPPSPPPPPPAATSPVGFASGNVRESEVRMGKLSNSVVSVAAGLTIMFDITGWASEEMMFFNGEAASSFSLGDSPPPTAEWRHLVPLTEPEEGAAVSLSVNMECRGLPSNTGKSLFETSCACRSPRSCSCCRCA
ncbi:hypothetical protein DQ04_10661020 [Trypanosoma grayi]|uniref:hypothetical protein n=1 Tax=Trypanosoma grayi TaxID=71804 RepID=UPI0004F3FA10|nr:hypothetical protein DQ04_10661020 [Trypanosoma grayi]KEG07171.1 hypothetical protein DQ04_10661020 [Trypanosoma grayi]